MHRGAASRQSLRRLYEPTSGRITLGGTKFGNTDVHRLQEHIAVVSQQPNYSTRVPGRIITFGATMSDADVKCAMHEFALAPPQGWYSVFTTANILNPIPAPSAASFYVLTLPGLPATHICWTHCFGPQCHYGRSPGHTFAPLFCARKS